MNRPLAATLILGSVLWAMTIVTAPSFARHERFAGGVAHVYAAASRMCHQKPERSFHLAGGQMPVCARCAGLYISGAAGALLAMMTWTDLRASRTRLLLAIAAAPTAITWTAEAAGIMPFSNAARALAALPLGLFAGWLFVGMLRYDAGLDGGKIHDSRSRARSL